MSQRKQNLNILFYSRVYGGMVTMKRVWGFAFFWFVTKCKYKRTNRQNITFFIPLEYNKTRAATPPRKDEKKWKEMKKATPPLW